jgi:hypothetical protein
MSMATYQATTSPQKEQARQLAMRYYKGGRVLSLSASNFIFEQELITKFGVKEKVDCYEYDLQVYQDGKPVYLQIKKNIPNLRFKYDNIFNAKASKYDFIFLDLCGCLYPSIVNEIISFLQGFKGVCFITVLKGREHFDPKDYGAETYAEFRDIVFPQLLYTYANMKPIQMFNYQSEREGSYGSPMRLYGFEYDAEKVA